MCAKFSQTNTLLFENNLRILSRIPIRMENNISVLTYLVVAKQRKEDNYIIRNNYLVTKKNILTITKI